MHTITSFQLISIFTEPVGWAQNSHKGVYLSCVREASWHNSILHVFSVLSIPEVAGVSRELSLHPVHLTKDQEGHLPPSALVPFCFYQMDRSQLGQASADLNLTVCNKFEPIILEGQRCYSLDTARFGVKPTSEGRTKGLFLLLDPNPYSQIPNAGQTIEEGSFKIFIHTLAQFSASGPGTYKLGSLKIMTGTESFEQLADNQKNCKVHNREDCQARKFLS